MNKKSKEISDGIINAIWRIIVILFKVFLWGYLLVIILGVITNNYSLWYPTDEETRSVIILMFILGSLFMLIKNYIKRFKKRK